MQLVGAAASFRGNFKSAAQKEVIKLYKLDDDPECDIKCRVEYLLDEWNFRFTDSVSNFTRSEVHCTDLFRSKEH